MKPKPDLIPKAVQAINELEIANSVGQVPNEFKGYIDSFGAAIVHNGLIPAVVFYESKGKDTADEEKQTIEKNRNKLMRAILQLLPHQEEKKSSSYENTLYNYILHRKHQGHHMRKIRQDVVDAGIAMKLALKTFKFTRKSQNDG
jgi:CRISPR type III-B/RAMP module-associated protein Cmr5